VNRRTTVTTVAGWAPAPLYRQPGILVTYHVFEVAGRRYAVADLSDLRTARGPQDPFAVRAVLLAGLIVAAVVTAVSFGGGPTGLDPATYLALLAAACLPVLLAVVVARIRPRPFELWGLHYGVMVRLFVTDDERVYGQVTRALRRAREAYLDAEPVDLGRAA